MEIRTVSRKSIEESSRLKALSSIRLKRLGIDIAFDIIFTSTDKEGRLGYFSPEQNLIVISDEFLHSGAKADEEAVFLHELAHAVDFHERGYSQHDAKFKEICRSLGVPEGFEKAKVKVNREKREKALSRVEKLIKLSESPFENESTEALKAAQRLMAEYGISMDEREEDTLYAMTIEEKKRFYYHEKVFVSIITRLSGVFILREHKGDTILLTAYGTTDQVLFAYETFIFLKKALKDAIEKASAGGKKIDTFSFSAGLASELYQRIAADEEKEISKALTISYKDNRKRFEHIFSGTRISGKRTQSAISSPSSYNKGAEASKSIRMPRKNERGKLKIEYKG